MSKERLSEEGRRSSYRRILSEDEVQALAERIEDALGQPTMDRLRFSGIDPEEGLRFLAVARQVAERRMANGLDIKTAAGLLKVAQYRLRDIEAGRVGSIVPDVLAAYIDHLRLKPWFSRWKKANPGLATRIGLRS
jgi:hypothetical protein